MYKDKNDCPIVYGLSDDGAVYTLLGGLWEIYGKGFEIKNDKRDISGHISF